MGIIVNPGGWQLRTAREGGLPSTARNGPSVQDQTETVAIRSQLLHDADPFLAILEEPPHHFWSVHYHTEPEVMIVLKGQMLLNGVWCHPGAVIYYAANHHYWHATGAEGCVLALARPGDRGFVWMGPDADASRQVPHPEKPDVAASDSVGPGKMTDKASAQARCEAPFRVALDPDKKYLWCACGLSKRQPFCDSSHKGTGIEPLAYAPPEKITVAFCVCKRTNNPPFCDGSHARTPNEPIDGAFHLNPAAPAGVPVVITSPSRA